MFAGSFWLTNGNIELGLVSTIIVLHTTIPSTYVYNYTLKMWCFWWNLLLDLFCASLFVCYWFAYYLNEMKINRALWYTYILSEILSLLTPLYQQGGVCYVNTKWPCIQCSISLIPDKSFIDFCMGGYPLIHPCKSLSKFITFLNRARTAEGHVHLVFWNCFGPHVGMSVCTCPPPRALITSGVIWCDIGHMRLVKQVSRLFPYFIWHLPSIKWMGVAILTQHVMKACQRKLRWCGTSYKRTTVKTEHFIYKSEWVNA